MHNRRGFNKQWRVFINEMKIKISLTKQQVMDASIVLPNVTILFPFQKHEFWYKHSDADQPHPCRPLNIPMIIIRSVTLQIHDEIYILWTPSIAESNWQDAEAPHFYSVIKTYILTLEYTRQPTKCPLGQRNASGFWSNRTTLVIQYLNKGKEHDANLF